MKIDLQVGQYTIVRHEARIERSVNASKINVQEPDRDPFDAFISWSILNKVFRNKALA